MTPPSDAVLDLFYQISAVPRGTRHEAKIRQWLLDWAAARELESRVDAAGNLVIYTPASAGAADQPPLILQSHLDMVWQTEPGSTHDFTRDPIIPARHGDWLRANGTTLGADNGIGMALMLALADDPTLRRPALELLFTVEEEMNVVGASHLDPALLHGQVLINLDSEEEGAFTIGCAGGTTTFFTLPVAWEAPAPDAVAFELTIGGLLGGHSGEDIDRPRANAIKLAARLLNDAQRRVALRLAAFSGGTARNAIPREASAAVVCASAEADALQEEARRIAQTLQDEYRLPDPGLSVSLKPTALPARVCGLADTQLGLRLTAALPNGVSAFSAEIPGFVETSNNIGVIELNDAGLNITSNQRSAVFSRLEEITLRLHALGQLAGAQVEQGAMFQPWQPNPASPLLARCQRVYAAALGADSTVRLSHGGLECGLISERCGGLDTLSMGPTIHWPHSPSEELFIPSVRRVWQFLTALLADFSSVTP